MLTTTLLYKRISAQQTCSGSHYIQILSVRILWGNLTDFCFVFEKSIVFISADSFFIVNKNIYV